MIAAGRWTCKPGQKKQEYRRFFTAKINQEAKENSKGSCRVVARALD